MYKNIMNRGNIIDKYIEYCSDSDYIGEFNNYTPTILYAGMNGEYANLCIFALEKFCE